MIRDAEIGRRLPAVLGSRLATVCLVLAGLGGLGLCQQLAIATAGPDEPLPGPHDRAIRAAARRHFPRSWDWRLLAAMVFQESRGDPRAVSPAGAIGLCQIMPASAREAGVAPEALWEVEANLDLGARLLRRHWEAQADCPDGPPRWDRTRAALAAYHAGPGVVARAQGPAGRSWPALALGLPPATRRHVEAVCDQAYPRLRRRLPGRVP